MKVRIWGFNNTTEWPSVTAWVQDMVLCQLLHRHDLESSRGLPPHCRRCGTIPKGAVMTSPEDAAQELAASIGYTFAVLTDGTIVLEPPLDPDCCGVCASAAGVVGELPQP